MGGPAAQCSGKSPARGSRRWSGFCTFAREPEDPIVGMQPGELAVVCRMLSCSASLHHRTSRTRWPLRRWA
eukprot:15444670-Alexandrium_andersonii.AAC.1